MTDPHDSPDVRKEYVMLEGEKQEDGVYILHGLPEGENFRNPNNWEPMKTGWLKIEGVAFQAASSFTLQEHQTKIVVTQPNESGGTYITFEEM